MEQSQEQIQRQQQTLKQTTSVNQIQLLKSYLLELPVTQLADHIKTEMDDNPALDEKQPDDHFDENDDTLDYTQENEQDDEDEDEDEDNR